MKKEIKNYHTHTFRCKHASGKVADYIAAGIPQGLTEIGITDHTPLPDNRWENVRMSMEELPDYIAEIEDAKRDYPEVRVLKGAECEYSPEYTSFYEDVLLGENEFDYLVGAIHYFPTATGNWIGCWDMTSNDLNKFVDYMIKAMETGLFTFMAHPDIFGASGLPWNNAAISCAKDILSAAEELNMPLEINGYGLRKEKIVDAAGIKRVQYPLIQFWEMASDYNITAVCNSDAHSPQDVLANIYEAINIAERNNLPLFQY